MDGDILAAVSNEQAFEWVESGRWDNDTFLCWCDVQRELALTKDTDESQ